MTNQQTFTSGGRVYEWSGGFGAIFTSRERGVGIGDVRMIEGRLFYVYLVYADRWWWQRARIGWTLPNVTIEAIRSLRAEMFGVEARDLTDSPGVTR